MFLKSGHLNIRVQVLILLMYPAIAFSQMKIEGKVTEEHNFPIPYASIKITNHNEGVISDTAGNFSIWLHGLKSSDTIIISSVGYEPLKIPALKASKKGQYILKSFSTKMEPVVVRSFGKEDAAGAKTDAIGYFRSWNTNNSGGEIGRNIYVPHNEYQVSRVRFKIFSTCDTTILRLHIREMNGGIPGRELVRDSIVAAFYNAGYADKTYDIDLLKYNIVLNKKEIFVSFQVLKGSSGSQYCSLSFVGSEHGSFFYKSTEYGEWDLSEDYAIHMKLFFRYD